jgi:hypothetical protein
MKGANFSLQRTAGLRFSRFVARWPAAAELRCWAAPSMRKHILVPGPLSFLACVLLLIVLSGCHSERVPNEKEVFDQSQQLFAAYLQGDLAAARRSLEEEIGLLECPKVRLDAMHQSTVLFLECARLYTLEKRAGRGTNAEMALIKARYWSLRRYEADGALKDSALEEFRSFTPERLIEITDASDKTHTGGKGPRYARKD